MKATSASIFSLVGQPLFNFAVGDIAPKRTWISWPKWKVKAKLAAKLDSAKTEPLVSVVVIPSGVKVPGQLRRCRRSCKTGAYNQSATIDSNGTVCWVNDELGLLAWKSMTGVLRRKGPHP